DEASQEEALRKAPPPLTTAAPAIAEGARRPVSRAPSPRQGGRVVKRVLAVALLCGVVVTGWCHRSAAAHGERPVHRNRRAEPELSHYLLRGMSRRRREPSRHSARPRCR